MEYYLSKNDLNERYNNIFNKELTGMQQTWRKIYRKIEKTYDVKDIPNDISEILIADYPNW